MIAANWRLTRLFATRLGLFLMAAVVVGMTGDAAEPAADVPASVPASRIRTSTITTSATVEVVVEDGVVTRKIVTTEQTEDSSASAEDAEKPAGDAQQPAEESKEAELDQLAEPTHKQVRKIVTKRDGKPVHLSTFCLDADGNVLACVSANAGGYGVVRPAPPQGDGANADDTPAVPVSYVQKYSPEGELVAEWPLEFNATVINVAADRTIFVAGTGQIARLSAKGDVLTTAETPKTVRSEEDIQAEVAQAKEANARRIELFQQQLIRIAESIAKVEETPEADRTDRDRAKLELYARQRTIYEQQIQQLQDPNIKTVPASSRGKTVTALALSGDNLFVCCGSEKGHGYDVWRCGLDFQNAETVLTGLGGCCGQCDIQAMADSIVVAENTRFRVGIYDADGKSLNSFGDRDRTSKLGFGSCCNPMNVRCCSNGDIITAESSIGNIKRFSRDGEFKSFIGKARVSGGCKHVAVGWDEKQDRYYLMNITDQSICVLVPKAEAPEFSEEELAANQARDGLGQKLIGKWSMTPPVVKAAGAEVAAGEAVDATTPSNTTTSKKSTLLGRAVSALSGNVEEAVTPRVRGNQNMLFEELEIAAEGSLKMSGGIYGSLSGNNFTWEAVQQEGKSLEFDLLSDSVQYFRLKVTFESDDKVTIGMSTPGGPANPATYYRVAGCDKCEKAVADAVLDVEVDCDGTRPLSDLIAKLGEDTGVTFTIDGNALKNLGMTKNMPQQFKLGKVPARRIMEEVTTKNLAPNPKNGLVFYYDAPTNTVTLTSQAFPAVGEIVTFPKAAEKK